jgi:hypothetical protein
MIRLFHHLGLLIRIKSSKDVEDLSGASHAEIPKGCLYNRTDSERLKSRGTLKKEVQLIAGDGLEFGEIVILRVACNLHCHLPERADAV